MIASLKTAGKSLYIKLFWGTVGLAKHFLPAGVRDFYREFRKEYAFVDRSRVTLFAPADLLPEYTPRFPLDPGSQPSGSPVRVTLIATVRNEASSARSWLESLLLQTRLPDEVVITDGGSTDDTVRIIRETGRAFPIPVSVIEAPGANIARGRNIAIQHASHPVIACTDFGCLLDRDWLHLLVAPFELDERVELSAGYYQMAGDTPFDRLCAHFFMETFDSVNPQTFLPSSRSLAMKKAFWARAGGYPEWLTDAGEDTLFDYQAKSQPAEWAFVPQAKVYWKGPASLWKLLKTYYRYAKGDGEVGTLAEHYWYKAFQLITNTLRRAALLVLWVLSFLFIGPWTWLLLLGYSALVLVNLVRESRPASALLGLLFYPYPIVLELSGMAQAFGFTAGVLNRPAVRQRQVRFYQNRLRQILEQEQGRKDVIVYLPTHDWGFMFQRPHQMARALARQGYLYFYCTVNEKTDSVVGFQPVEPGLYLCHVPLETFSLLESPAVYVGSAWNRGYLPLFDRPQVIYDHYDDLEVSGANREDHLQMLRDARVVLVTSRLLHQAVEPLRPDALLAPNGVDYERIQGSLPAPTQPAPADWAAIAAAGRPVAGYSGALAEWFDYDLLAFLASSRPDLEFALVGVDYDGSLGRSGVLKLENVHWLGMKAYEELFQYVCRFDLGLVPFKVNDITLATSPIKIFEYMACGVPVLTTALPECRLYPGVFVADTYEQFLENLEQAMCAKQDPAYLSRLDATARQNTWDNRARLVKEALAENLAPGAHPEGARRAPLRMVESPRFAA